MRLCAIDQLFMLFPPKLFSTKRLHSGLGFLRVKNLEAVKI